MCSIIAAAIGNKPQRCARTIDLLEVSMRRCLFIAWLIAFAAANAPAQPIQRPILSVLDFGASPVAKAATETIRDRFRASGEFLVVDPDLSRTAAKGIGYSGSLNLTVTEARDLGAALATEFYIIGDAQTLRRSSFQSPVYYESYCSIFLVSARTGRLLLWNRPSFQHAEATVAEARLSQYLSSDALIHQLMVNIRRAQEDER